MPLERNSQAKMFFFATTPMDNLYQEDHELSMYLTAISMEDSINLAPAVECALSKGIVDR